MKISTHILLFGESNYNLILKTIDIWDTEESMRNSCLDKAKEDCMDYMIIQDADEFYFYNDYEKMINFIKTNPNYTVYKCPWISFWKNLNYVTIKENGDTIMGYPEICLNLNKGLRFTKCRSLHDSNTINIESIICYHLSYVMSDEEVYKKINVWGHSHQFDTQKWYEEKWLNWSEESIGLHPIQPHAWFRAIKYTGELPEILIN